MPDKKKTQEDDLQKKVMEAKANDQKANDQKQKASDKTCPECKQKDVKIEELTNTLARAMADLQNFKRRTGEDQFKFIKFANAELLKVLLPIINNFDRSAGHMPEDLKKNDWAKGVLQIHDDFLKTLEKIGVKKIKTVGEKLNPRLHEGLITGPGEKDVIIEELEPGYIFNDEVLKPAKVKVGNGTK
jgi:molecular chaperone GrpE